jgi:hypothetical protein
VLDLSHLRRSSQRGLMIMAAQLRPPNQTEVHFPGTLRQFYFVETHEDRQAWRERGSRRVAEVEVLRASRNRNVRGSLRSVRLQPPVEYGLSLLGPQRCRHSSKTDGDILYQRFNKRGTETHDNPLLNKIGPEPLKSAFKSVTMLEPSVWVAGVEALRAPRNRNVWGLTSFGPSHPTRSTTIQGVKTSWRTFHNWQVPP